MTGMTIQERYDDIAARAGISQEVVRRVFKATRESAVASVKKGENVTVPGLVTFYPDIKTKLDVGGMSRTRYLKVKAKASSALETELAKISEFDTNETNVDEVLDRLTFSNEPEIPRYRRESDGIRLTQISALL